jgi:hypothetical protein
MSLTIEHAIRGTAHAGNVPTALSLRGPSSEEMTEQRRDWDRPGALLLSSKDDADRVNPTQPLAPFGEYWPPEEGDEQC